MVEPYTSLTDSEKNAHLSNTIGGYQAIYPSGEAHFFDASQTATATTFSMASGIFDRNGLNSNFSSGPVSRNYAITNFTIFNKYIDVSVTSKGIDMSGLYLGPRSAYNFNIYDNAFRVGVVPTPPTTPPPSPPTTPPPSPN